MIADATGAGVGVGGIMGGAAAEISSGTTTVLLEAANFGPEADLGHGQAPRAATARPAPASSGASTSSSPLGPSTASSSCWGRACAGGRRPTCGPPVPRAPPVALRTERANLVLGTSLSPAECAELIRPLGFEVTAVGRARQLRGQGADLAARLQP